MSNICAIGVGAHARVAGNIDRSVHSENHTLFGNLLKPLDQLLYLPPRLHSLSTCRLINPDISVSHPLVD